MKQGEGREPSHRRYGVLHRPSGRPGMTVMDWVNDGGRDQPLDRRDGWLFVLFLVGIFAVAFGTAALFIYVL